MRSGYTLISEACKRNQGYTLIELLITISIIGALASIGILGYSNQTQRARDTERKSDIRQYQTALETYANKSGGVYPIRSGNGVDVTSLCGESNPLGDIPCQDDPIPAQNYMYVSDSQGLDFVLWAEMERTESNFIVCSNGDVGELPSSGWSPPVNGSCPL